MLSFVKPCLNLHQRLQLLANLGTLSSTPVRASASIRGPPIPLSSAFTFLAPKISFFLL